MNIIIDVASACSDNGKPTQRACCALRAKATDSGKERSRLIVRPLGSKTANEAELYALLGGIMVVRPLYRTKCDVTVRTSGKYALKMCERSEKGYSNNPSENKDLISKIRDLLQKHPNIKIAKADKDKELSELAKRNVTGKNCIDEER